MVLSNASPLAERSPQAGALPRELYLEVTNVCNSRCRSCPLTYDHFLPAEPKHHLTWDEFRHVVNQLPQIDRAVLHGIGEPLLNPDLPRFIAHLKARGAQVLFNTNAILLDEARRQALTAAGLDEVRVSLDAVSPELYAQLRGVDKLPQVIRNLKAFMAQPSGNRPRLSLWLVGLQANLHQVPDFVRLGAEIGVPEVYLQRLVYFGAGAGPGDDTTMTPGQSLFGALEAQQQTIITEGERLAQSLGLGFRASGAASPSDSIAVQDHYPWQQCRRPWSLMYLTANGTALPCCIAPFATPDYQSLILGNGLEQPLAEVWNGPRYQALRRAVLSTAPEPWPCQFCGRRWSL